MKVKQGTIVAAYKALDKIMRQNTTLPVSKKTFDMQRKLQAAWDFQIREEEKIAARHPNVNPDNASVQFPPNDEEIKKERMAELDSYVKDIEELLEMEAEIEIEPFTIYMSVEAIRLPGNDIKALQGFIDFEE
jgi:hypothetical protein